MSSSAQLASSLILQSPPGQINDCYQDLHGILQDEQTLTEGVKPALKQYNLDQYLVTELPGLQHPVLLCKAAVLDGNTDRYIDPKSKQSFEFDHLQLTASNFQPLHVWDSLETTRSALQEAASNYAQEHLSQGVAAVFSTSAPAQPEPSAAPNSAASVDPEPEAKEVEIDATPQTAEEETAAEEPQGANDPEEGSEAVASEKVDEGEAAKEEEQPQPATEATSEPEAPSQPEVSIPEPTEHKFTLTFVGNRYNPSNFWAGRWRSSYEYDQDSGKITGSVIVHVHYYEQGNVQLHTSKEMEQQLTPGSSTAAKEVLKCISEFERSYQLALNEAYADLQDTTFKELRRALPVTKQKLDWNRITSYKLKGELRK